MCPFLQHGDVYRTRGGTIVAFTTSKEVPGALNATYYQGRSGTSTTVDNWWSVAHVAPDHWVKLTMDELYGKDRSADR
jgi:hypothetical protein